MLSPGPVNGDLRAGLEGWTVEGREDPVALVPAPGVRLRGNVTLVSPPLVVPAGAQALTVTARSPGGPGVLLVRARPEGGGAEVPLGTLEPARAARPRVGRLTGLAGRTVRIVLDPVPALGTSLDVLGVGPVTAPLPGWRVDAGVPDVRGAGPARRLVVTDTLALTSPPARVPRRARAVTVAIRGDGRVRLRVAGRIGVARAGARWGLVRVSLPPRIRGAVRLRLRADPGAGGLELRALGRIRS